MTASSQVDEGDLFAATETARLAAVRRHQILDTPPDGAFDRVTELAAQLFDVPICIISVVDEDRIWFKSHYGLTIDQIDRAPGLCASAILQTNPWVITDAQIDVRALANPLVTGEFGLRFYVGVPLRTSDGFNLGTLCIMDRKPRTSVPAAQLRQLMQLATLVTDQLELRLAARKAVADLNEAMDTMQLMSKEIDHRVMNSLQIIASLLSLQSRQTGSELASNQLKLAANRVMTVAQVHRHFYIDSNVQNTRYLEFLRRLCGDLAKILNFEAIEVDGTELEIATIRVVPLALIVTELVTNSVKYGATRVLVAFRPTASGFNLVVRDDGPGIAADIDNNAGLGMKLVHALTQQIQGTFAIASGLDGRGAGFSLEVETL